MSRLRRIEEAHRFFFITTNLSRESASLSRHERTLVLADLMSTRASHDFLLFAFVIMPDHIHLLCYPREAMLSEIMRHFKSRSALTLRKLRHTSGPIWQSRFFDSICRKVRHFWEQMDYIHQNPVRARLASRPQDWPWSSAAANQADANVRIDPIDLPADRDALLWPAPWG